MKNLCWFISLVRSISIHCCLYYLKIAELNEVHTEICSRIELL